jgi:hypothetical protein
MFLISCELFQLELGATLIYTVCSAVGIQIPARVIDPVGVLNFNLMLLFMWNRTLSSYHHLTESNINKWYFRWTTQKLRSILDWSQTSCYKISAAAWCHERICLTAALFSQARYSALSDSTHLLDSGQNKRWFSFRLWGLHCGSHSTCRSDTMQLTSDVSQTVLLWLRAFPVPVGAALPFVKLITLCSLCLCIVLLD